jgi:hypothetical protein
MLCMRSADRGSYWAKMPEEALTTLELNFQQLRQLVGPRLAKDYTRCHEPIVRWDYWVPPSKDPFHGVIPGGWVTSHAWRVQYFIGRYARSHVNKDPERAPVRTPVPTPASMPTPAPVPTAEPTPAPTPTQTPMSWLSQYQ